MEGEVTPTVLEHSPALRKARTGGRLGQETGLTLGPSEWDLPTGSTSQKRPKLEERQCLGMGGGASTQARPTSPLWTPSSGRDCPQGPI